MTTIKLAEEKDLIPLSKIFSNSFTQADPEKPWDEDHSYEYLKYWFKKQPDMFYVAFDNENPIGATAVNIKPWRTGVRCSDGVIFVDTKYQKQGIGKMLLKKVIQEAKNKYNATIFEAITFAGDEFPLTWYKKIGINVDEHAVIIKGECEEILKNL